MALQIAIIKRIALLFERLSAGSVEGKSWAAWGSLGQLGAIVQLPKSEIERAGDNDRADECAKYVEPQVAIDLRTSFEQIEHRPPQADEGRCFRPYCADVDFVAALRK
jgi:hypothetical protein